MLRAVLEEAGRRLPGCSAAVLVGHDGMVIEKWAAADAPSAEEVAAELTPVLRSVKALGRNMAGGEFRQLTVSLAGWSCLMLPVSEETLLVMIARHDAVPGRIRYEAARAASRIEAEL